MMERVNNVSLVIKLLQTILKYALHKLTTALNNSALETVRLVRVTIL